MDKSKAIKKELGIILCSLLEVLLACYSTPLHTTTQRFKPEVGRKEIVKYSRLG